MNLRTLLPGAQHLRQRIGTAIRYCFIADTDNDAPTFGRVAGEYDDDGNPGPPENVRIMQDFGLRTRPVAGSESIKLSVGAGMGNGVLVATENTLYGPTDLQDGEVALYNSLDQGGVLCRIRLSNDGSIVIVSKNAEIRLDSSSGNVTVNGGGQPVARKNDNCGYLAVTTSGMSIVGVTWVPMIPVPPLANTTYTPITIQAGAGNFLG